MAIDNYTPSFKEPNGLLSEPLTPTANSEGAFQVTIPSDFDFSDISSGGYWNATGALLEDVIIIRQFNNSTIKIGAGDLWRAWTYSDEKSGSPSLGRYVELLSAPDCCVRTKSLFVSGSPLVFSITIGEVTDSGTAPLPATRSMVPAPKKSVGTEVVLVEVCSVGVVEKPLS